MTLTDEQHLEMHASIKIIESHCVGCKASIINQEKRISKLEKFNVSIIAIGAFVGSCMTVIIGVFK